MVWDEALNAQCILNMVHVEVWYAQQYVFQCLLNVRGVSTRCTFFGSMYYTRQYKHCTCLVRRYHSSNISENMQISDRCYRPKSALRRLRQKNMCTSAHKYNVAPRLMVTPCAKSWDVSGRITHIVQTVSSTECTQLDHKGPTENGVPSKWAKEMERPIGQLPPNKHDFDTEIHV